MGGNHPRLLTEEQHQMYDGFGEKYVHPRPIPLADQDYRHPPPNCPPIFHVLDHHRPVIIRRQYHSPQVIEGLYHYEGAPIGAELP